MRGRREETEAAAKPHKISREGERYKIFNLLKQKEKLTNIFSLAELLSLKFDYLKIKGTSQLSRGLIL